VTGSPIRQQRKGGYYFVTLFGQAGTIGRLGPLLPLGGVP
jgi:hypothetical protein